MHQSMLASVAPLVFASVLSACGSCPTTGGDMPGTPSSVSGEPATSPGLVVIAPGMPAEEGRGCVELEDSLRLVCTSHDSPFQGKHTGVRVEHVLWDNALARYVAYITDDECRAYVCDLDQGCLSRGVFGEELGCVDKDDPWSCCRVRSDGSASAVAYDIKYANRGMLK